MGSITLNTVGQRQRAIGTVVVLTATVVALTLGASQAVARLVSCGEVITTSTRVDNDLSNCPGDGLVIGADRITLNLNGHTIDGDNSPGLPLSDDEGVLNGTRAPTGEIVAHDGITIKNGVLREFDRGVRLDEAGHNVVRGLRLVRNVSYGLVLSGARSSATGNVIERNFVAHNGRGIFQSDSFGETLIRRNVVVENRENGIDQIESQNTRIRQNLVVSNGIDGIQVDDFGPDWLVGNFASGNGDDGIEVQGFPNADETTVSRNTANHNGDFGIEAAPGVTDGGGNRARGNGNPLQCLNVFCR